MRKAIRLPMIQRKLIETGTLHPRYYHHVRAGISGELIYIIPEGKYVKEGDKVAVIQTESNDKEEEIVLQRQTAESKWKKTISDLKLAEKNQKLELEKAKWDVSVARLELDLLKKKPLKLEAQRAECSNKTGRIQYSSCDRRIEGESELV